MANFITTLPKLTSLANYPFWEICVKLTLALITYPGAIFTTNNVLNALALFQITNMNEIARRNFLGLGVLNILNFILPDNLLIYGQPNAEALWAYLQTLIEISGPVLISADYQKTIIFQIFSNQDFVSQITKLNFPYMRLYENNCDISLSLQIDDSLNSLTHSTQFVQTILKYDYIILCTNTMAAMEDFVALKKINYVCMASSQNRFILPNLPITVNLSKYKKALYSLYKNKTVPYGRFYKDEWFLDSSVSTHFTLFKSDFVNITLDNYG